MWELPRVWQRHIAKSNNNMANYQGQGRSFPSLSILRKVGYMGKEEWNMPFEKQQMLLEEAMKQAQEALNRGDEPYGAVVATPAGEIIAADGNRENTTGDPTRHAEINAIGKACAVLGTKSLVGFVLVGNYRPCPMCSSAILMTGIRTLYCGSFFQGFDALFEETAQKVRQADISNRQDGLDNAACSEQVHKGREMLFAKPGYFSGYKSGVI